MSAPLVTPGITPYSRPDDATITREPPETDAEEIELPPHMRTFLSGLDSAA